MPPRHGPRHHGPPHRPIHHGPPHRPIHHGPPHHGPGLLGLLFGHPRPHSPTVVVKTEAPPPPPPPPPVYVVPQPGYYTSAIETSTVMTAAPAPMYVSQQTYDPSMATEAYTPVQPAYDPSMGMNGVSNSNPMFGAVPTSQNPMAGATPQPGYQYY